MFNLDLAIQYGFYFNYTRTQGNDRFNNNDVPIIKIVSKTLYMYYNNDMMCNLYK